MKKLLLIVFIIMGSYATTNAQSFGIKAGLNFANFSGNDANDFNVLTSFHAGMVAEIGLLQSLTIQPELLYSVQGAEADDNNYKLNYITVPVMAKIYLTDSFNLHGGPQASILISESESFDSFNSNTYDFGFAGGAEFFFADSFSVQARYISGVSEISDDFDLKNSVLQLSLCYMF
ncbi:porin family protein [Flavobacterium litorale]|uniref:PorT family protein n=1 Tax=Flavobacterium litorale TaxID=2856519 RepID=A0ABX8V7X4_9FLAO|nr:porin family protein [Flavobacterium litorale]QYJ68228.1 PorT family protein [Flavobacterium litorale]